MVKAEDFIAYIDYFYFNKDKSDKIRSKDKKFDEIWKPIDLKAYGRCYTAQPTPEMMKFGIKKVAIILWQRSLIFFHNPGMLTTAKQRNGIDIMLKEKFYIDLEYELFRMLDFGGQICIDDSNYNKDLCAHKALRQVRKIYILTMKIEIASSRPEEGFLACDLTAFLRI